MHRLLAATLLSCTALAATASAEPIAGYDRLTVRADHRAEPIAASIWYPAGTPTYRGLIGDNAVFTGTPALVGAALAPGRHPLVLLSHGSGGNMDGLGWLSSRLALDGAIVLAVNHPGSTSGDSSPRRSIRLDERAADLTAALDTLFADPMLAAHVDPARIAVLGFSLGGATALNLAGARLDRTRYRDYCTAAPEQPDCVFFAKGGVDLTNLSDRFEADMRDPRIGAAIAIDPAFTYAITPDSAAAMTLPVLVVNLGGPERWKGVDVGAAGSDLVHRLADIHHEVVAPANHFTFLGLCKPEGAALLMAEQDDPVCDDPPGVDRASVHAELAARIIAFLDGPARRSQDAGGTVAEQR